VYLAFAALAAVAAFFLPQLFQLVQITPPWWVEIPSVLGFYGFITLTYEKWLWKWASTIPDLNGTWIGEIRSSHNNGTVVSCVMRIKQTWTHMSIELDTEHSHSKTTMAALYEQLPGERGLKYEFVSEPNSLAVDTMHAHRGACRMDISPQQTSLKGNYYTGRDRMNLGELAVAFLTRDLLDYNAATDRKATNHE
jgi:hypothetical protein